MNTLPAPPAAKPHILVVDDDDRLRDLLRLFLTERGFIVSTASGAAAAREKLASLSYDLVVLDIMMPGETGIELAQHLRRKGQASVKSIPILFLTARAESSERIEGFEAGADDYLTKPFEPRELLLRINAILRRVQPPAPAPSLLKLGNYVYDTAKGELRGTDGEAVRLTEMEAGLLRLLAAEPGAVISRERLATINKGEINDRTIDVQVTRLRRKIEGDTKNPRTLITVRGEGYRLMPDGEGSL